MLWYLAVWWAQSSALTIHSGLCFTTFIARLLVIRVEVVQYDSFCVECPLALPLLREGMMAVLLLSSLLFREYFKILLVCASGLLSVQPRSLLCSTSVLPKFVTPTLLRFAVVVSASFRKLKVEGWNLFRSESSATVHATQWAEAVRRLNGMTRVCDFSCARSHIRDGRKSQTGLERRMSDGTWAGEAGPWPMTKCAARFAVVLRLWARKKHIIRSRKVHISTLYPYQPNFRVQGIGCHRMLWGVIWQILVMIWDFFKYFWIKSFWNCHIPAVWKFKF